MQRLVYHRANEALGHADTYIEQEEWIDVKHVDLIDTITGCVQCDHYAHHVQRTNSTAMARGRIKWASCSRDRLRHTDGHLKVGRQNIRLYETRVVRW
ncbi:unnamed protein product [Sphagnum balticum]